MSEVIIHGFIGSPFGRAVAATLIEKGAPWRIQPVGPGEARKPAHLARHPFGRAPAIEHDGFGLYETQAILRYLDQVFDGPTFTPNDPRARARMNQVIGIIDSYFFPVTGHGMVFNRVVAPKFGMQVDEAAVAASIPGSRTVVEVLDGLLGDRPHFGGETLSLADLHAGPHIDMMNECAEGAELLAGTRLPAWLDRLNARQSFRTTTWDALLEAA
jgi:glutathione S-transferase